MPVTPDSLQTSTIRTIWDMVGPIQINPDATGVIQGWPGAEGAGSTKKTKGGDMEERKIDVLEGAYEHDRWRNEDGVLRSIVGFQLCGDTVVVAYEPGNATRYVVAMEWLMGIGNTFGGHDTVVSLPLMGRCMTIYGKSAPEEWSYVAEKLGLGRGDAEPLHALLHYMCDVVSNSEEESAKYLQRYMDLRKRS